MRIRPLLLVALLMLARAAPAEPSPQIAHQLPAAVEQLKQDPLMASEETVRTLSWKRDEARRTSSAAALPRWLLGLFEWLNEAGRALVAVLALIAAAWLIWRVRDWVRARRRQAIGPRAESLSHVQDLDIRPESLPADIGARALELWRQGNAAGALSLLYRGALSRLVHVYGASVRPSSTEGECLRLARAHMPMEGAHFFATLVALWQQTVYAQRTPKDDRVSELCEQFNLLLPAPGAPHSEPTP